MTKEEIIELAREAEMGFDLTSRNFFAELERFANLVAAKERKRCLDVIYRKAALLGGPIDQAYLHECAEAIRSLK